MRANLDEWMDATEEKFHKRTKVPVTTQNIKGGHLVWKVKVCTSVFVSEKKIILVIGHD